MPLRLTKSRMPDWTRSGHPQTIPLRPPIPSLAHFRLAAAGLLLALSAPLAAHDFWIQPAQFATRANAAVIATLQVGHGEFRQRSPIAAHRIVRLDIRGPGGVRDLRSALPDGDRPIALKLPVSKSGTYVVGLMSDHARTELSAIRFNDYLRAEGLTPAIDYRQRTGASDDNGREIYRRCAKLLLTAGHANADGMATRPIGLKLEIVPERDPGRLRKGEPLPVRVFYDGSPLAGALVKLTDLANDAKPVAMKRTNASGRAGFVLPRAGQWLLNVIWTEPIPRSRQADFDTTFSSLAFDYAPAR